ncbi:MAG: helix-turn-helix transcriptional regulator [Phyllobacteriaceae bacterium]|nr:helix-turn-helix transcriptional regulator [Phyllobacteriaceae bacterium]
MTALGVDPQAALCRLVAVLGHAGFMDDFARECAALYGADQVTAFVVEQGRTRCVLAHRPGEPRLVQSLVRAYTRGFVERDPLLGLHLERGEDFVAAGLASADIGDDAYRHRLFRDVGLASKIAILSRHDRRALYVNLYFRERDGAGETAIDRLAATGRMFAACVHKHEALIGGAFRAGTARARAEAFLAERFPTLSARERQVAAAIACGLSVEAIALDLDLAASSVITFRRRVYAKLAIGGRGELFAQVAGLAM